VTNPLVHALVFALAVVIPGGLLVYFAWRAYRASSGRGNNGTIDDPPTPDEARAAFLAMYPPESLRARSRSTQLGRAKAFRRRNSQK
jgi:hypothetical protein